MISSRFLSHYCHLHWHWWFAFAISSTFTVVCTEKCEHAESSKPPTQSSSLGCIWCQMFSLFFFLSSFCVIVWCASSFSFSSSSFFSRTVSCALCSLYWLACHSCRRIVDHLLIQIVYLLFIYFFLSPAAYINFYFHFLIRHRPSSSFCFFFSPFFFPSLSSVFAVALSHVQGSEGKREKK